MRARVGAVAAAWAIAAGTTPILPPAAASADPISQNAIGTYTGTTLPVTFAWDAATGEGNRSFTDPGLCGKEAAIKSIPFFLTKVDFAMPPAPVARPAAAPNPPVSSAAPAACPDAAAPRRGGSSGAAFIGGVTAGGSGRGRGSAKPPHAVGCTDT